MDLLREEAREIPVFYEADICVLGGSCTGVFAAVRAARLGAKVVIIEKQNAFGGVATSGLVNIWHSLHNTEFNQQIIAGLTLETIERLDRIGAVIEHQKNHSSGFLLNTEELKIELDRLVQEANVKVYLHTMFVAPYVVDGELQAAIVENKSGRGAIKAQMFIDATGDGDLCDRLGIGHRISPEFQPSTACAKIDGWEPGLQGFDLAEALLAYKEEFHIPEGFGWGAQVPNSKHVYMYAGTRVYHANSSDGEALTYSEMEGRRQVRAIMDMVRKYGQGNQMSLVSLPSYIGTRETRHIDCHYQLTGDNVLHGHRFDDAIANGSYRVDIHHQDKPGLTFRYLNGEQVYIRPGYPHEVGKWREPVEIDPTFYQIPYRSLLPQGPYKNVIVAGRMLDVDETAFGGVRVMVNMNQLGEAAGVAAYIGLSENKGFVDVDVQQLRHQLKSGGSIVL
ncbi:FAD-dependent oxidoreductase [Paenibacillus whitsoniae]|uniref:FAD-dependent oxidoreductase n=1 Tax=Paenibacillus whitsoniae TaxID=2496558 RepID=A0A430JJV1_9BACL|nr:FAD-dependent oxidoreductase [Paenibacillus whitsoniae]RTE11269.1 FAD-dependent oxidoreductase [Paenibacillus whitsoniae]